MKKSQATITLSSPFLQLKKNTPVSVPIMFQLSCLASKTKKNTPRKNLSLVIDTSGSMSGKPLNDAVLASCSLLDKLTPNDQVGIISYHSVVDVVSQPLFCTAENVAMLKQKLRTLVATDSTALHAGWLHGAQQVAPFVKEFDITRVIVLSDGCANVGLRDPQLFKEESIRLLDCGISTSTYGVGPHFDEAIMTLLAQGGNAFYAQSSEELIGYFDNEFSLMDNVALSNIRAHLTSSHPLTLLNDLPFVDHQVLLPSVVFGSQAWCVFQCDTDGKTPFSAEVTVSWEEDGQTFSEKVNLSIPLTQKLPKKNKTPHASFIEERCKELVASKMQQEAMMLAKKGQWEDVNLLMNNMTAMAGNNAYIAGVSATLQNLSQARDATLFSKEAAYASTTMSRRISAVNEDETSVSDTLGLRKTSQGKASLHKGEEK